MKKLFLALLASLLLSAQAQGALKATSLPLPLTIANGGNGITSLPRVPAGTNTPLPTTNFAASKPVNIDRVSHYTVLGGGNLVLCYANWQTGSTGEQLNAANMQTWNHYVQIDYKDDLYKVTFNNGQEFGQTANGAYICSDPVIGLHLSPKTTWYEFIVHVPANYLGGVGVPPSTLGANGQYYYDTQAANWYGPKSAGAWGSSSGTDPWLTGNSYIIPVTHYTHAAFSEYHATSDDPTLLYAGGTYPRGFSFDKWYLSGGFVAAVNPANYRFSNGGWNYTWRNTTCTGTLLDLSAVGPTAAPACGTPATASLNFQNGTINPSTPTSSNVTGAGYTGPLAYGCGVTTQAWGASAATMIPDGTTAPAWVLLVGDSIESGIGASDAVGDQYRQFGIYQRMLSYPGNSIPKYQSWNWAVAGITVASLESTMNQSQAMYTSAMGGVNGSNVLINAGSNDYSGQSANGYLANVKVAMQTLISEWKALGVKHAYLATIFPRVTGNQGVTTAVITAAGSTCTINQAPCTVTVAGGTGTAATVSVNTNGSGAITAVNSISNAGSYSVKPATPNTVTGCACTNSTLTLSFSDAVDTAGQTPVNIPFGSTLTATGDDVDVHNTQIIAGTLVNNQDGYIDLASWVRDPTNVNAWRVSGGWTTTANTCLYVPTTDYIHPSKPLMVYSTSVNQFPTLTP